MLNYLTDSTVRQDNKAGGKVLAGLVRRRQAESRLYLEG